MEDGTRTTAYPLRTERLLLRPVREEDVDALTAYRNDPQVAALQDWDLPYEREWAEGLAAAHVGRDDVLPGGRTQIGIECDGDLVGDVYLGLHEDGGVAEIGFTLAHRTQQEPLRPQGVCGGPRPVLHRLILGAGPPGGQADSRRPGCGGWRGGRMGA